MIAARGVLRPIDGRREEAKLAATELMSRCAGDDGLLVYCFTVDEDTEHLVVIEAYRDSAAWIGHMKQGSFERMNSAAAIVSFEIYGDEPSPELKEILSGLGSYKSHRSI